MKCRECGAEIREGSLYCDVCGAEVRIVPDYSSLDEVLAAHVRGEIEGAPRKRAGNPPADRVRTVPDEGAEGAQTKKKKRKGNKRKKKKMILILSLLLAVIIIGFIVYRGSYGGLMQRGHNALDSGNYEKALGYFESAAKKEPERVEAYTGMSEVYIAQKELTEAENVFLGEISTQPENADIYRAAAEFYLKTEQPAEIPLLLDSCDADSVLAAMSDYMVEIPDFSVTEGTYEEEQKLVLSSEGNTVYYTLDGEEPTEKTGTKYGTEIELDEGEWTVRAIAVNKKGVPSLVAEQKITVELPLSDPPIVAPSSGLYESAANITIQVEEGFTAYYAFGTTEPTQENWTKYTGPIAMPEGNTIFSAVLVDNSTEKISAVTVRNYELSIVADSEEGVSAGGSTEDDTEE